LVLFSLKVLVCEKNVCKVAFTKLGSLYATMAVKDREKSYSVAVNVIVADVSVLHTESPPLHGGEGKTVA
jgi:hypothetical protein